MDGGPEGRRGGGVETGFKNKTLKQENRVTLRGMLKKNRKRRYFDAVSPDGTGRGKPERGERNNGTVSPASGNWTVWGESSARTHGERRYESVPVTFDATTNGTREGGEGVDVRLEGKEGGGGKGAVKLFLGQVGWDQWGDGSFYVVYAVRVCLLGGDSKGTEERQRGCGKGARKRVRKPKGREEISSSTRILQKLNKRRESKKQKQRGFKKKEDGQEIQAKPRRVYSWGGRGGRRSRFSRTLKESRKKGGGRRVGLGGKKLWKRGTAAAGRK